MGRSNQRNVTLGQNEMLRFTSLSHMIDHANLLQYDVDARRFTDVWYWITSDHENPWPGSDLSITGWLGQFDKYPKFRQFLLRVSGSEESNIEDRADEISDAFDEFQVIRALVNDAVRRCEEYSSSKGDRSKGLEFETSGPIIFRLFNKGKHGKDAHIMEVRPSMHANLLNGIDPLRLRRCRVCPNAFYAARSDSEGCSPRHNAVFRQQRYRMEMRKKELAKFRSKLKHEEEAPNRVQSVIDTIQAKIERLEQLIGKIENK